MKENSSSAGCQRNIPLTCRLFLTPSSVRVTLQRSKISKSQQDPSEHLSVSVTKYVAFKECCICSGGLPFFWTNSVEISA